MPELEFGLDSFGDVTMADSGQMAPHDQVIRDVVAEAELADRVGVDFIGLGEHHRDDFAISAPEIVLAGIAARTTRLRLGSAVTVLSSDDPIRVFQRFSTLDALSNGRAEIVVGRGSFTESFPLFGFDLADYEVLFEDKLDLLARLAREREVTWSGRTRPALTAQKVFPPVASEELKLWVGVGGTPQSVVRAAHYRLPLVIAIIGGDARRFRPFVDLYHRALGEFGAGPLPVGVHSPGHIAATDAQARDEYWFGWKPMHDRIGRERGWSPISRADFDREVESGALCVGAPETVARKIARTVRALGLSRFSMKYSAGPLQHEALMRSIELYGRKVLPMVRDLVAKGQPE